MYAKYLGCPPGKKSADAHGRIDDTGSHKPASVLSVPPVVVHITAGIINNESFLAYFMSILKSCVAYQVSNCQPGCPPSQSYTFSARLLFDETFAQPGVFAVANCPVVALGVFYSTVLMRSLKFLQLTALTQH